MLLQVLNHLTKAAEQSVNEMPDDLRQSITNAKGKESYPISSYTYLLIYENQKDKTKGKTLKEFLSWSMNDGEKFAADLGYAPLPPIVVTKTKEKIEKIKF